MTSASSPEAAAPDDGIVVIYDGECPFCTSYVRMVRLREAAGPVRMVDARAPSPEVDAVKVRGFDLNEGMIVRIGGEYYHGADAMNMLSMMSSRSGMLNRMVAAMFRSSVRARLLYPALRWGRALTLKALGRRRIGK